ncbi:MAG TPA: phosphoribosylaminoimidazolesuccinocarboxamide synthase [Steroidobacteraceae bacterium]|nr:phosphoribosylaminoimidazolesuccinocarboxamide synthase [Steroidobacteraceae bacterium]
MNASPLLRADLPNLFSRGKVRDSFDLGNRLLIVATDRISAFDVVMPNGIPDKGRVLTQMSGAWFEKIDTVVPSHFIRVADGSPADELPYPLPEELIGRSMIVHKAKRLDVECIVRGYLAGTGWKDYQATGKICGIRLPRDLRESEALPDPIFTPSTKAAQGHDENITYEQLVELIGPQAANVVRLRSLAVYRFAAEYALARGIIIADTKLEFGYLGDEVILIDEVLTPDSSRFWPLDRYRPGGPQPSYDKQYLRDSLTAAGWNYEPPAPELPPEVVEQTAERYRTAFRILSGGGA